MKRLELNNFILTDGEHTLNSTVPGDISADLLAAGIIPDPFFSDNFKSLGWIHERDWTYTAEFSGEELDGEITELILEEVDVFSEVYLNGELLGSTDNAFKKFTFDISGKIKNAKGKLQTQHGEIGVEWSAEGDNVLYVADIPQGVLAIFTFNNAAVESYRVEGQRHIYKLKRN